MKIGILAGEVSGDILGSSLIREIKQLCPDAEFTGIGGPMMMAEGCESLFPMEKLSVMGILEVISHYRELKQIQKQMIEYFIANPPDVFIGIDVPDFNLGLEGALKAAGITTVHYVSPSVWAWRQYRIKKIVQSVDLMLTLFPFEKKFYDDYDIDVVFVGHTLADEIDFEVDKHTARSQLGIADVIQPYHSLIALLPGSRDSEVTRLSQPFLDTAVLCQKENPEIIFITPLVSDKHCDYFRAQLQTYQKPPNVILVKQQSRLAMAAADAVLLASGTAALEALLLKKPMIACYKMSPVSYWVARKLAQVPYFSLPNLLAGEKLIEEIAQDDVNDVNLAPKVLSLLETDKWQETLNIFYDIHKMLRNNASRTAAKAILDYTGGGFQKQKKEHNGSGLG